MQSIMSNFTGKGAPGGRKSPFCIDLRLWAFQVVKNCNNTGSHSDTITEQDRHLLWQNLQFFKSNLKCNLTVNANGRNWQTVVTFTRACHFIPLICFQIWGTNHVPKIGCINYYINMARMYGFWHAPLGVHQVPEWTILSHVNCIIQEAVTGFQVLLDSLHPRSTRAPWWSPTVLQWEAVKIFSASVSSGIRSIWPNRVECHAWTIAKRCACLVTSYHLTSSLCTMHMVVPFDS